MLTQKNESIMTISVFRLLALHRPNLKEAAKLRWLCMLLPPLKIPLAPLIVHFNEHIYKQITRYDMPYHHFYDVVNHSCFVGVFCDHWIK